MQNQLKFVLLITVSILFQNCKKTDSTPAKDASQYGYLNIYQATNLGAGTLSVYVDGKFEGSFTSVDPDGSNSQTCEINGFQKELKKGLHTWRVTGSIRNSWENTEYIEGYGICSSIKLIN